MAILLCLKCRPHPFQDSAYGKNMRVHNPTIKANIYICTVCGNKNEHKIMIRERKENDSKG